MTFIIVVLGIVLAARIVYLEYQREQHERLIWQQEQWILDSVRADNREPLTADFQLWQTEIDHEH